MQKQPRLVTGLERVDDEPLDIRKPSRSEEGEVVALKPSRFAGSRRKQFQIARGNIERKANRPSCIGGECRRNVAQIYGFEQSGTTSALVMELVEGEDLGHPRPAEALAKAELARKIAELIAKRRLTQAAAAEPLNIDQPKVSALVRGRHLTSLSEIRIHISDIVLPMSRSARSEAPD